MCGDTVLAYVLSRSSNPLTGPAVGPEGRAHLHDYECNPSAFKIDVWDLAGLFGLPEWEKIREMNEDYIFGAGRGVEDEEEQMAAQDAASQELFFDWASSVESTASQIFEHLGLQLDELKTKWHYTVLPTKSWDSAALKLIQTINGVGMFEFSSVNELISSGPYKNAREAVLKHLHWAKYWPEVYESSSARSMFERRNPTAESERRFILDFLPYRTDVYPEVSGSVQEFFPTEAEARARLQELMNLGLIEDAEIRQISSGTVVTRVRDAKWTENPSGRRWNENPTAKGKRSNPFMVPEYATGTAWSVETTHGGDIVLSDLVSTDGYKVDEIIEASENPELAESLSQYVEGEVEEMSVVKGWFAHLTAHGYMDQTEWAGPFKTQKEAEKYIEDTYEVDPETGEELE
jgi:hypothetical protein